MAQSPQEPDSPTPTPRPSPAPPSQRSLGRTFEALHYRDFRLLFIAHMTNSAAVWMQMIGLPILVIAMTDSPVHLGLVLVARTVPSMVLGIFSGVFADMFNRKTILLMTRLSGTALAVWFAAIAVLGPVSLVDIYVFAILRGITMAFDQAPRRALIPSMVPPHAIVNAMAVTNGGQQMTRATAPAIAGLMISLWGIPSAFVAMAVLYVVGLPFLVLMRIVDHEREGYRGIPRIFRDAGSGIGFALKNPIMRSSLIVTALYFIFGMSFTNVFAPLLASGPLKLDEGGLGWLVAVMGIGGTAGTLTVAYVSPERRRGVVLTTSLALFGMLLMGMAGASYLTTPIVAFVVIFFVGAGQAIFMPLLQSIVLQAAPVQMRGRAMAILSWDRALVSFGSAVAGFAAGAFGSQAALLAFGGACAFGGLMLLATGTLRRVD